MEGVEENEWTRADEDSFHQLAAKMKELEARRNGAISRMQNAVSSILRQHTRRYPLEECDVINFIIAKRKELIEALGGADT
jgi:hypothetical protein